ncbi:methylenetetrahydrofolate reductase C-terminal domain-containing protein [Dermatobacter hominis]|nr:methylenetetrahydrofolate reductase C-terminal domain-containing protein [Dermatobacter hominis]
MPIGWATGTDPRCGPGRAAGTGARTCASSALHGPAPHTIDKSCVTPIDAARRLRGHCAGYGRTTMAELSPRSDCPKRMVFGPCGGVRSGDRCEVDDRTCPFVGRPAPAWPEARAVPTPAPRDGSAPWLLTDVRPIAPTLAAAGATADLYAGWTDTVLLGEHHEEVDLPNVLMAQIALDRGLSPWVTLTCRDRNRVALEADLVALQQLGVAGVHCVTGDARAPHVRPGSAPVFDLDSLRLTRMAAAFGLLVSVAETPQAPPIAGRPGRAADKFRAGATWCIVNAGVTAPELEEFVRLVRRQVPDMRFVACVPVFTDAEGAERLRRLPGVRLADREVAHVLAATDPVEAGVEAAVAEARAFLAVEGVEGVNLSGPASTHGAAERAAVMRAVTERLR